MREQTRVGRLTSNAAAIAVGTLSAQLVNFLMLPFLTSRLSTAEYGSVDLSVVLVALIGPIASLSVSEAVLRFGMQREFRRASVFLVGMVVIAAGFILSLCLAPYLASQPTLGPLVPLIYMFLAVQLVMDLSGQFLRAQERVRLVASAGVVYSLLMAVGNLALVGLLGWGATGNLMAMVIAGLLTSGALLGLILAQTRPRPADFDASLMGKMLRYSSPLTPNGVLWWAVNSASRLVLLAIQGPAAVGLYAVAARVPTLLSMITQVFWQAWQLTAIEQKDSPTRLAFQNKVLAAMAGVLLLTTSGLLMLLQPLLRAFVSPEFFPAWQVVPPLLGAAIFLAFATFWGTEYRVQMSTVSALWTSVLGSASAIALNFLLIPSLAAPGAALGTCGGYATIWLSRVWDLRRRGWIPQGLWRLVVGMLVLTAQAVSLYQDLPTPTQTAVNVLSLMALLVLHGKSVLVGVRAVRASRG